MFHSILFAASSYLDVLRNEHDNPVTYYHYLSTIRMLKDRITGDGPLSATSIAAAMHLWHYKVSESLHIAGAAWCFAIFDLLIVERV